MAHSISNTLFGRLVAGSAKRNTIPAFFALARQRRALAKLDAQQLSDIGVSPRAARDEAKRPVWDVPAHWRA